jgi:hypothetical protein
MSCHWTTWKKWWRQSVTLRPRRSCKDRLHSCAVPDRFFDLAHVLFGKPVPTFPGHALVVGRDGVEPPQTMRGVYSALSSPMLSLPVNGCRPRGRTGLKAAYETAWITNRSTCIDFARGFTPARSYHLLSRAEPAIAASRSASSSQPAGQSRFKMTTCSRALSTCPVST